MNPRERVWAALSGRQPDRVPKGEILITPGFLDRAGASLAEMLPRLGADLVTIEARPSAPPADVGFWARQGLFVFVSVPGPMQMLLISRGLLEVSRLLMKDPARAAEEFHAQARAGLAAAERALAAGAEGVVVLDDLAGNTGPLFSPQILDEVYFPALAEIPGVLARKGVPTLFHSDGNVTPLLRSLQGAGFSGIQGLQPAAGMDPAAVQAHCPAAWVFWGNYEFEGRRRIKTPDEAAGDARDLRRRWAGFPGFIFGSCGGLYDGIHAEPVLAAYRAIDE